MVGIAQKPSVAAVQEGELPVTHFRTATVNGIDIFYREAGPADGPVVLLLHGFPTSSSQFRHLIPLLADRYRVIAPDFPGFGHSASPDRSTFDYTFANFADLMDGLMGQLEVDRYAIYCFDYGAPTGYRLALKGPERVSALIVQNGNAYEEGLSEFWDPLRQQRHAVPGIPCLLPRPPATDADHLGPERFHLPARWRPPLSARPAVGRVPSARHRPLPAGRQTRRRCADDPRLPGPLHRSFLSAGTARRVRRPVVEERERPDPLSELVRHGGAPVCPSAWILSGLHNEQCRHQLGTRYGQSHPHSAHSGKRNMTSMVINTAGGESCQCPPPHRIEARATTTPRSCAIPT